MNKEDNSCATCSLRHCTILKNCREEFLELIDRNKYCLKYVKGQQLFREGSEAEGIFVINSGVVKVQVKGFRKRPFILYLGMVGDMIGYQTSADKKNQVSAIAVETTNVCFIENKDFDSILQNNAIVREDLTKEFNREGIDLIYHLNRL